MLEDMRSFRGDLYFVLALLLCGSNHLACTADTDMTVEVAAGTRSCFFENVKVGQFIEVDFQVIDGGDLDITFITQSPTGYAIITDIRKSENTHRVTASEDGDYKFCFDNTFSRFSIKLVYFELSVENADGVDDDDDDDEEWMKFVRDEETLGISIDNMKEALAEVKSNLAKSIQLQTLRKAHEAKDRNVMETNYTRVNTWSIVFICILISTGIVQVVMIRGLFDEKSMAHKMMKKLQGQQNQYY